MQGENSMEQAKDRILAAACLHAPFDGWSDATLRAALADSGVAVGLGQALFPRGGIDLAVAYHRQGDATMRDAYAATDLAALRIRDRITLAVRLRLQAGDKELVRRGSTLFGLPHHAAEGAGLIWATADAIWTALGDASQDLNWYTKRATLSAVYAATVLFWLGDTSEGDQATWEFLDRRIENVMQFEKTKASLRENPLAKALLAGPLKLLAKVRAPQTAQDLPGHQHGN
jgi:ubiquinone biosynthesis protein COQ9